MTNVTKFNTTKKQARHYSELAGERLEKDKSFKTKRRGQRVNKQAASLEGWV